jgi:hypothetical protein
MDTKFLQPLNYRNLVFSLMRKPSATKSASHISGHSTTTIPSKLVYISLKSLGIFLEESVNPSVETDL